MLRKWLLLGVLGLLAMGLLAVLVSQIDNARTFRLDRGPVAAELVSGSVPAAQAITATAVLEAPRYVGQDIVGQSWEIVAKRATQVGKMEASSLLLEDVAAVWQNPGDEPLRVAAGMAVFNQDTKMLNLERDVKIEGLRLSVQAPSMAVAVVSRTAVVSTGVVVAGQVGAWQLEVRAPALWADQPAGLLRLTGGVKARLVPGAGV